MEGQTRYSNARMGQFLNEILELSKQNQPNAQRLFLVKMIEEFQQCPPSTRTECLSSLLWLFDQSQPISLLEFITTLKDEFVQHQPVSHKEFLVTLARHAMSQRDYQAYMAHQEQQQSANYQGEYHAARLPFAVHPGHPMAQEVYARLAQNVQDAQMIHSEFISRVTQTVQTDQPVVNGDFIGRLPQQMPQIQHRIPQSEYLARMAQSMHQVHPDYAAMRIPQPAHQAQAVSGPSSYQIPYMPRPQESFEQAAQHAFAQRPVMGHFVAPQVIRFSNDQFFVQGAAVPPQNGPRYYETGHSVETSDHSYGITVEHTEASGQVNGVSEGHHRATGGLWSPPNQFNYINDATQSSYFAERLCSLARNPNSDEAEHCDEEEVEEEEDHGIEDISEDSYDENGMRSITPVEEVQELSEEEECEDAPAIDEGCNEQTAFSPGKFNTNQIRYTLQMLPDSKGVYRFDASTVNDLYNSLHISQSSFNHSILCHLVVNSSEIRLQSILNVNEGSRRLLPIASGSTSEGNFSFGSDHGYRLENSIAFKDQPDDSISHDECDSNSLRADSEHSQDDQASFIGFEPPSTLILNPFHILMLNQWNEAKIWKESFKVQAERTWTSNDRDSLEDSIGTSHIASMEYDSSKSVELVAGRVPALTESVSNFMECEVVEPTVGLFDRKSPRELANNRNILLTLDQESQVLPATRIVKHAAEESIEYFFCAKYNHLGQWVFSRYPFCKCQRTSRVCKSRSCNANPGSKHTKALEALENMLTATANLVNVSANSNITISSSPSVKIASLPLRRSKKKESSKGNSQVVRRIANRLKAPHVSRVEVKDRRNVTRFSPYPKRNLRSNERRKQSSKQVDVTNQFRNVATSTPYSNRTRLRVRSKDTPSRNKSRIASSSSHDTSFETDISMIESGKRRHSLRILLQSLPNRRVTRKLTDKISSHTN